MPRPTDARQREAGIARLVEPDVDALAFGVERVGVGGQRDDFGLAVVADHGVVTGDRLMYIAEGNVGIGAFQPQRVPLARHAQNGVVGDGRCGEIARDMLVLRVDDGVERLDVAGGQHRVQVVGERLAVAEFIRIDRCGVHRLPAPDAQLDAHVAGRASQIAVERLDFSPFVGDRVGQVVYFGLQGRRQLPAACEQSVHPDAETGPVLHIPLRFVVGELRRREVEDRQPFAGGRNQRFVEHGRAGRECPFVVVAAAIRMPHGFDREGRASAVERIAGRGRQPETRLFQCYTDVGRQRDETQRAEHAVLVRRLVTVADGTWEDR